MTKHRSIPPPLRAVTDTIERDGAYHFVLECGHTQRIGVRPAKALYCNCQRCAIEFITQNSRTEATS